MISFQDKKVAVLGTGIEGLSSARFLKAQGALVTLLDQKNQDQLHREIVGQAQSTGTDVYWGPDYLQTLSNFDIVVRTPVIRPDIPELTAFQESGKLVTSNTKIFFDNCPCPIIGVTGTKGKGTTSTLIYEILKKAGKNVYLGGNIGTPPLDFLPQVKESDLVVLELSSFQLFDADKSPHVGVVLMVTSEHLDWHKDEQEYKEAKFNILRYQNASDFAVVNIDYPVSKEFLEIGDGEKIPVSTKDENTRAFVKNGSIFVDNEEITKTNEVGLVGEHNLENIVAALAATKTFDVSKEDMVKAVKDFKGLEHRLEFVQDVNGVSYYNDSFSTTPETAIAAIKSFQKPEIVILGGSDKGSNYTELGQTINNASNVKALILIGQMAPKIKEALQGQFQGKVLEGAKDMPEIISQAQSLAESGDVVLLSPACASFDMFANYKNRGELFKRSVGNL